MSALPSNDFMVEAIFDRLPTKAKLANSGFTNFDCPICNERRGRCGVIIEGGSVGVNCFKCGFKARWSVGYGLSVSFKQFLAALDMPELEISDLIFKATLIQGAVRRTPALREKLGFTAPYFDNRALPDGTKSMDDLAEQGCTDPDFLAALAYARGRGRDIFDYFEFYWSPDRKFGMNRRIIIPMLISGHVVGYSARAIDAETEQRYYTVSQPDFLFNSFAFTDAKRKIVVLCEGIFDAIALDSVGLLGAKINRTQIAWINSYRKKVILLPDRDKRGFELIDIALEQGWHVAFPWDGWWDPRIKDAAEATRVYGRLWTMTGVIATATDSPARIAAQRLRFAP